MPRTSVTIGPRQHGLRMRLEEFAEAEGQPGHVYELAKGVVQVVSPGQERRDYEEKRDEYLAAGVREYWIADPQAGCLTVLSRRGDVWDQQVIPAKDSFATPLLPGFLLELPRVLGEGAR